MSAVTQLDLQLTLKNILFATDFSEASEAALPHALDLARKYGSKVFITHAIQPEPNPGIPLDPLVTDEIAVRAEAEEKMRRFAQASQCNDVPQETRLYKGYVWDVIKGAIEEHKIDLLVVGTHGRSALATLLVGSIAEEILRKSPIPVMTIGPHVRRMPDQGETIRTVLFATDFSEASARALPYAISLAQENQARLVALHMAHAVMTEGVDFTHEAMESAQRQLHDFVPQTRGCHIEYVVRAGSVAEGILAAAVDVHADLLVMGIHAGSALSAHTPWKTAHRVVAHANCPVLSVRW